MDKFKLLFTLFEEQTNREDATKVGFIVRKQETSLYVRPEKGDHLSDGLTIHKIGQSKEHIKRTYEYHLDTVKTYTEYICLGDVSKEKQRYEKWIKEYMEDVKWFCHRPELAAKYYDILIEAGVGKDV